jgi:integrase
MLAHSEDAPCPTVGEVWERWALPAYERRASEGDMSAYTLRQYRSGWNAHAAPRWASVPCDAVRPLEVQQWLDGMARAGAQSAMNVLRPTLDYAVRYGQIATNPFRERYLMPGKRTVERMDAGTWTLEELGGVWRVAWGRWWEAAFLLSAFGGLRVGESLAVTAERVGALEVHGQTVAMVEVRDQMPSVGSATLGRLKNAQSVRTVPVPGLAGRRLIRLAAASDGYLSGDGMGSPSTQRRLMLAWKSEVPDGMRHPFRNLRNSWQTNMRWALRMPPWVVEPILGHIGQGVTAQHYDRPRAEMFAEQVADAYAERPYDAGWEWADV